jgi:hypothetical protein
MASAIDERKQVRIIGKMTLKLNYVEKNLSQYYFLHHKSHTEWPCSEHGHLQ